LKDILNLIFCSRGKKYFSLEYLNKEKIIYININDDENVFLHNINVDENYLYTSFMLMDKK
jgi:RecA-family ATPase